MAILAFSSSGLSQGHYDDVPTVSLVQLLSSPDKYDKTRVVVLGFLTIGQENNRLYLGKNDYDNALLPNSIWVDISDKMIEQRSELTMKYVRLAGTFHLGYRGRSSILVGGIGEISDCSIVSDPDHPFSEKLKGLVHHDPNTN